MPFIDQLDFSSLPFLKCQVQKCTENTEARQQINKFNIKHYSFLSKKECCSLSEQG